MSACPSKGRRMKFLAPILSLVWATSICAMETQILYLKSLHPAPPVLSNLDPIPENLGVAGASLGIASTPGIACVTGRSPSLRADTAELPS